MRSKRAKLRLARLQCMGVLVAGVLLARQVCGQ